MDEFDQVRRLLAEKPPPSPDVVAAARARLEQAARRRHLSRPRSRPDAGSRWDGVGGARPLPGWLAPAAAAGTVVAVVLGTLSLSSLLPKHGAAARGAVHRSGRATTGPGNLSPSRSAASSAGALASVPPYLVALVNSTQGGGPRTGATAQFRATATGAVLGSVTVPVRSDVFAWVSAAADDRTFVFGVRPGTAAVPAGPTSFYKLVLSPSGQPGPLTRLPIPPITSGLINGFALSPDGGKLAVSLLPRSGSSGDSQLDVYSVATGAGRTWAWQGANGRVGWTMPVAGSLSWENNNRTLLYSESNANQQGARVSAAAYLLDTAAPGGSLLAASTRIPLPGDALLSGGKGVPGIAGPLQVTGDGSMVIVPTDALHVTGPVRTPQQVRQLSQLLGQAQALDKAFRRVERSHAAAAVIAAAKQRWLAAASQYSARIAAESATLTISEFSVSTGKLVRVVYRTALPRLVQLGWAWADSTGATLIAEHLTMNGQNLSVVWGVQTANGFTPLPASLQRPYGLFW